uniref:G-protein coupled receptors family 1 profile domain-containing protein n=1 Tax=Strongyloides stercoralis TaxID=6248 RepID=A0A0K0E5J8_STRER
MDFPNGFNNSIDSEIVDDCPFLKNIQVGIISFVISFFNIIIESLACYSFYMIRRLNRKMPFEIMRHQSQLVLILQFCHFITSIITIFDLEEIFILYLIIGSLLEFSYVGYVAFVFLLTLCRFDIMYNNCILSLISRKKIFSVGIILCYLLGFVFFIFYMIPKYRLVYNDKFFGWTFQRQIKIVRIAANIKGNIMLLLLLFCLLLHTLIIFKVIYTRCNNINKRRKKISVEDLKLLAHIVLCFLTIGFLELCWLKVFPFFYLTKTGIILSQLLFNAVTGINTIFTLIFVKDVSKTLSTCFFKDKNTIANIKIQKK